MRFLPTIVLPLLLMTSVIAPRAADARPTSGPVEPVARRPLAAKAASTTEADYARRERKSSPELARFEGGSTLVIAGSTTVLLLLLIIVILL